MPVWLMTIGKSALGVLASLGASLLTEEFLKYAIVKGLRILVKKTESKVDDDLLAKAEELWDKKD